MLTTAMLLIVVVVAVWLGGLTRVGRSRARAQSIGRGRNDVDWSPAFYSGDGGAAFSSGDSGCDGSAGSDGGGGCDGGGGGGA